jgi:1,4-alpha-glucan branching enzyme
MKSFSLNIQQWFRATFAVPVMSTPSRIETRTNRMNRARRRISRNHTSHSRRVCLEFVNRQARRVAIAGSFNDWRPAVTPMVPMGGGWWVKGLALPPGRYEYRLVVDGRAMPDPNAAETMSAPDGGMNSVLVVREPARNGGFAS